MGWRYNVNLALGEVEKKMITFKGDRYIEFLRLADDEFDSVFGPCPELYTPEDNQLVVRLRAVIKKHTFFLEYCPDFVPPPWALDI